MPRSRCLVRRLGPAQSSLALPAEIRLGRMPMLAVLAGRLPLVSPKHTLRKSWAVERHGTIRHTTTLLRSHRSRVVPLRSWTRCSARHCLATLLLIARPCLLSWRKPRRERLPTHRLIFHLSPRPPPPHLPLRHPPWTRHPALLPTLLNMLLLALVLNWAVTQTRRKPILHCTISRR